MTPPDTAPAPPDAAPVGVWVAVVGSDAYIRVKGRASFTAGPALKQFGLRCIEQQCRRFILDLGACESADSTFIGVLAGLAMRLKKQHDGDMLILNLSASLRDCFATLGLDQVAVCFAAGQCPDDVRATLACACAPLAPTTDRRTTTDTVLEAHADLARLSDRNVAPFQDVMTFLRHPPSS